MAKKKSKKSIKEINEEIRSDITARLIDAMSNGLTPWKKMWRNDPNCGFPANVKSERPYSGVNVLLLELDSMVKDFAARWWGTYKNWQELTGEEYPVKKGEHGTQVIFVKPITIDRNKDKPDEEEDPFTIWVMKTYTVFNVEQCKKHKKIKHLLVERETTYESHPDYDKADAVVAATGADIRYKGNRAFYHPSFPKDYIQMPPKKQYPLERDFHDTRHHELIHWTEPRLNWDRAKHGYAMGELIAEIGACFLSSELGIPGSDDLENHAKYLKHWLEGMKNDTKFIFDAASQASKAVDFILKRQSQQKGKTDGESRKPNKRHGTSEKAVPKAKAS